MIEFGGSEFMLPYNKGAGDDWFTASITYEERVNLACDPGALSELDLGFKGKFQLEKDPKQPMTEAGNVDTYSGVYVPDELSADDPIQNVEASVAKLGFVLRCFAALTAKVAQIATHEQRSPLDHRLILYLKTPYQEAGLNP